MDELIERVAAQMGMKPDREVQEVVPVGDGHAVRTHDDQWTLVRDDGTMRLTLAPAADEATAAMLRGFRGEPESAELASGGIVKNPGAAVGERECEEVVVAAPKRRGRS